MEAAQAAEFDPNAAFRERYGSSPYALLIVLEVKTVGFENLVKAESISPPLDEPMFIAFTSEKTKMLVDDYFSFNGEKVSFLNRDSLQPQTYKAKTIASEAFRAAGS